MYDVKKLLDEMKKEGISEAEVILNKVYDITVKWIKEGNAADPKSIVSMILLAEPQLSKFLKEAIDKIDGEEG